MDVMQEPKWHTRRAHPLWGWIAVLATLGLPLMLLTIAFGAGDTSQGNSSSPFIAGDAVILGVPLVIGWLSYIAMRRTGTSRRKAVVAAVAIPVGILIGITAVFWLLVVSLS
jgi:hypothetical protein